MTPKQERFVEEYLVDLNATRAAIRAGYSSKTAEVQGHQLLKKTSVRAVIDAARAKMSERTAITQDFVLNGLRENYERAMQHEEVVGRDGMPTGEYTYNGAVANRALELLGKHLGMFVDRHEHDHKIEVEDKSEHEEARALAFLLAGKPVAKEETQH